MGFDSTVILRPGLLDRGDKARFMEKVSGEDADPFVISGIVSGNDVQ